LLIPKSNEVPARATNVGLNVGILFFNDEPRKCQLTGHESATYASKTSCRSGANHTARDCASSGPWGFLELRSPYHPAAYAARLALTSCRRESIPRQLTLLGSPWRGRVDQRTRHTHKQEQTSPNQCIGQRNGSICIKLRRREVCSSNWCKHGVSLGSLGWRAEHRKVPGDTQRVRSRLRYVRSQNFLPLRREPHCEGIGLFLHHVDNAGAKGFCIRQLAL
jgi:hypothetical protein